MNKDQAEIMQAARDVWGKLSAAEKRKYAAQAKQNKEDNKAVSAVSSPSSSSSSSSSSSLSSSSASVPAQAKPKKQRKRNNGADDKNIPNNPTEDVKASPDDSEKEPTRKRARKAGDPERSFFWHSYYDTLDGKCNVCGSVTINVGQFQFGHIISEKSGGPYEAWNLVPQCACNQKVGKAHLFDYMAVSCSARLLPLGQKLFHAHCSVAEREKLLKVHGTQALVAFVKAKYAPPGLDQYKGKFELTEGTVKNFLDKCNQS